MNFIPSVRAVLFDVDGTLYSQTRLRALMALELATMPLVSPFRAGRRLAALRAYRRAQEVLRKTTHTDPAAAQLDSAAAASGLPVAEVQALVAEWMHERPLKYLQFCRCAGVEDLLNAIARAGMEAGVLSDYPAEAKLESMGLGGWFSPVLCASDAGIRAFKPDPRGFLRACEIWSLSPEEVLFVGDRPDVDGAGAEAAGMRCAIISRRPAGPGASYVVFESLEELKRAFVDRR
jgi:HAD superfamily hydrolase (TIGR01549 family)